MSIFAWIIALNILLTVLWGVAWWRYEHANHYRRRHTWKWVMIYAGVISITSWFIISIVAVAWWSEDKTCGEKADGLGRNYEWSSWTGCMIETDDGQLVPLEQLRINESGES